MSAHVGTQMFAIAPANMTTTQEATDRRIRGVLLTTRGLRGFGDGLMSVSVPAYLTALGFSALQIGTIVTATLIGASLLSLVAGLSARRFGSRPLFVLAAVAMIASGAAYAALEAFIPLLLVALLGAINPSSSDSNMTAPLEQARLSAVASGDSRTSLFSHYTLIGSLATALGVLAAGLPQVASMALDMPLAVAIKGSFIAYAAIALVLLLLYRQLPEEQKSNEPALPPLVKSRHTVPRLAAVFALDSFGGGFAIQSILAIWLFEKFGSSLATVATILFAAGLASSLSLLLAPWLERVPVELNRW